MNLFSVLHSIERAANRYGRYIEPLISLHLDFFIRVFVRVHHGKIHVKQSCTKVGYVCKDTFTHSFVTYPTGRLENTKNGGVKFHPGTPPQVSFSKIPYFLERVLIEHIE